MREILKQYTKSELTIMGWRSAEMAANMESGSRQGSPSDARGSAVTDERMDRIEQALEPIAHKLENEAGELDLSKLTGAEVARYLGAIGMPVMTIGKP